MIGRRTHTPSYYATKYPPLRAWQVRDPSGSLVDIVRSSVVAQREVDALNNGAATVDHHACLGCRVVMV